MFASYIYGVRRPLVCTISGCERPSYCKTLCRLHYKRLRRHGDPNVVIKRRRPVPERCAAEPCTRLARCLGFCRIHYRRFTLYGDPSKLLRTPGRKPCRIPDCTAPATGLKLCLKHYHLLRYYGDPLHPTKRRPNGSGSFRCGYRRLLHNGRRVDEHRIVWEQAHGPIPPGYHIHHIDGDKLHNDLSNLQLLTPLEHKRLHPKKGRRIRSSTD